MSQKLVAIDFDGTMTDAEAEGRPFTAGYLEDLAALTGRELAEVHAMAERFAAEVQGDPQAYGWECNGCIVAPAVVDPYLRIMPVARKILDATSVVTDAHDRARLLDGILFKYNYRKTVHAFRPHAAAALAALEHHSTWIVTNAHTDAVKAKVRDLEHQDGATTTLDWLLERVRGRAQKQVIDDAFTDVERELAVPGLRRPVLLRRPHYKRLLDELRGERPWHDVVVVGDIFELDLSLPLVLGARVVLAANAFTPAYERDFVAAHPAGRVIEDLRELEGVVARA